MLSRGGFGLCQRGSFCPAEPPLGDQGGYLYSGRVDQTVVHQTARSVYLSREGPGTWGLERSDRAWGFAQSLCCQTAWVHILPPSPTALRPWANLVTSPCLSSLICKLRMIVIPQRILCRV